MYLVLLPPLFGVLSHQFGVSLAALGLAMGVQGLVNTGFQLPFGYVSDNYSRRLTLGICLVFGAAGVAIIATAASFAWLVVGEAVLGIGVAGHHPAQYPLLADASEDAYRGRLYSVHAFAGNLGFAAGPAVIAAVVAIPGANWRDALGLVGVVGGLYAVVALAVLVWYVSDDVALPDVDATAETTASLRERVGGELRSLTSSPAILALAALTLVTSTASWGVTTYTVTLLTGSYGVGQSAANLTLSAMFVASAAAVLVGGGLTDRFSAGPVMLASYGLLGVFVLGLASMGMAPLLAVAVAVVAGGVRSLGNPARSTLTDRLSARTDLGKNFAVITIGIMLGSAIAPPVFGALMERVGAQPTFVAIAGVAGVALLLTLGILRTYRTEFAGPTPGPADD